MDTVPRSWGGERTDDLLLESSDVGKIPAGVVGGHGEHEYSLFRGSDVKLAQQVREQ